MTPKVEREPDPMDLMMLGKYEEAILAYEAIAAEGDPLGVCAAQIAFCRAQLATRRARMED
jgi:hypothetical protein